MRRALPGQHQHVLAAQASHTAGPVLAVGLHLRPGQDVRYLVQPHLVGYELGRPDLVEPDVEQRELGRADMEWPNLVRSDVERPNLERGLLVIADLELERE